MKRLFALTLAVCLSGCFGSKVNQELFGWKSASLRIEVVYTGRAGANDGKILVNWYDTEHGPAGSYLLFSNLEYVEESGVGKITYDEATRVLSVMIENRESRKILRIPIASPTRHRDSFIKANGALLVEADKAP